MIVADSSYITEGLLRESSLLDDQVLCAPDYAFYEVINAIWKHQVLLNRVISVLGETKIVDEIIK